MNKSVLMSIRPQYVAKILKGNKTIEVRKKFPKDYVGWVYIYCTKEKPNLWLPYEFDFFPLDEASQPYLSNEPIIDLDDKLNGKVVARFWCDKVEHFEFETLSRDMDGYWWDNGKSLDRDFLKKSCLDNLELRNYIGFSGGYAIHISKLEMFEKPKELKEFGYRGCNFEKCYRCEHYDNGKVVCGTIWNTITKAPQSWCCIEGE